MDSDNEDGNFDRPNNRDDDDYDFNDNPNGRAGADEDPQAVQKVQNRHYDEEVEVSENASEVQSDPEPEADQQKDEEEEEEASPPKHSNKGARVEPIRASVDSEPGDEDKDGRGQAGGYNPADYEGLDVSSEVKDLFKYITRYRPTTMDLETKIKAFIPDYIPAVGEVDAFLKPSRPDNQTEGLGLLYIDEPSLNQTKESKMQLIIKQLDTILRPEEKKKVVHSVENAEKNAKEINGWIADVSSVQKQAPSVAYSKQFPDIDTLMQVWPAEIEDALQGLKLPTEDVDMTLEEYARLCCALVDIPVHQANTKRNLIESMHVYFTLFAEFQANQHFQQQNEQFVYEG